MSSTTKPVKEIVFDGHEFGIKFEFVAGFNVVLKKVFNAKYQNKPDQPYYQFWRLSRHVVDNQAKELFEQLTEIAGYEIAGGLNAFESLFEDSMSRPEPNAFTADIKISLHSLADGGTLLMNNVAHLGVVSVVKAMGGGYISPMRAWRLSACTVNSLKYNLQQELKLKDEQISIIQGEYTLIEDALHQTKKPDDVGIKIKNFSMPEPQDSATEVGENAVYLAATSPLKKTNLSPIEIQTLVSQYQLYDYQKDGVEHLITNTSALLADDMGLGKSRQAVVAADILSKGAITFILCPASLMLNWAAEIRMIVPDTKIAIQKFDPEANWFITNYDRLESVLKHASQFQVMIIDEAHSLKESTAQRTRLAFDVAAVVPYRYLLTGTPILNRESELHTLLRLSGHPLGNVPLKEFEKEFAGSPEFRNELHKRISEWMLRRKKENVLKTLKGKKHQIVSISPSEEQRAAYNNVVNDGNMQPLEKIGKLRRALEELKVSFIVETIEKIQKDDKALIFCEYTDTVFILKGLLEKLGIQCVTLIGTDSPTKRAKAELDFQTNPDIQVFIGTTKAAGVGINLTAANYVFFASLPWTPGLQAQAEDRAYRNGQQRMVIVLILIMIGSIDEEILTMLKHKSLVAGDILDPTTEANDSIAHIARKLAA